MSRSSAACDLPRRTQKSDFGPAGVFAAVAACACLQACSQAPEPPLPVAGTGAPSASTTKASDSSAAGKSTSPAVVGNGPTSAANASSMARPAAAVAGKGGSGAAAMSSASGASAATGMAAAAGANASQAASPAAAGSEAAVASAVAGAGSAAGSGGAAGASAQSRPPLSSRYKAKHVADPSLPKHTIYRPEDLSMVAEPMPIVVWGNGGCLGDGEQVAPVLDAAAAYGILVIASGDPGGTDFTEASWMLDAVTWAVAENSRAGSQYEGKLDTHAISAQGLSCGGIEAVTVSSDPRVTSTILWSSGIFSDGSLGATKDALTKLHGPTAWITGGPSDVAYDNAVDDYSKVPDTIPAVLAHYGDVGHGAMLEKADEMAGVLASWIDAAHYDMAEAKHWFVGPDCGLCMQSPWKIESKNWP